MTTIINHIPDRSGPGSTTTALPLGHPRRGSDKWATGVEAVRRRIVKVNTMIGTWNVRSLRQSGKVEMLVEELDHLKWNILGIAEMRWKGVGEGTTEAGHKIWFCGDEKKNVHGVGFLVNKNTKNSIIECMPVNERIIAIRVAGTPLNMTIVQVYAPTSECSEEVIDDFYEELEKLLRTVSRKDILVVQGDFNAKIGKDAYAGWKGTVGKFGIGNTNERGLTLLEFAKRHQLTAVTTLFDHKRSRRTTWHSPDGKVHNQIDFILVSRRHATGVNRAKTRTFNKPDIGSDHDLVMMTLKVKLRTNKKNKTTGTYFDLEKLKDQETAKIFQGDLAGKFSPLLLLDQDPQALCDEFTTILEKTAEETLGRARKIKKPWITPEVLESCDKRREKKKKKKLGPAELAEYRTANAECRRALNEAKNKWVEEQSQAIESNLSHHNNKMAYEVVKKLSRGQRDEIKQKQASVIEDKNGTLLTKIEEVSSRWRDYCEELYNYPIRKDLRVLDEVVQDDDVREEEEILMSEVECAIKDLKRNKSPGADNIRAELIQGGGESTTKILHKLCNEILRTKKWPSQWTESVLVVIPKKANSRKCSDHRTISLISHASKVMLKIIQKRITPRIEEVLSESQAGFRRGRSTIQQITTLRILNEKARDTGGVIFHNFIDFRKAFDRVWHEALWNTMGKYNIGKGITTLIQNLYDGAKSKVRIDDHFSDWFRTSVGVRQGCLLSPTLFNLFLERIMEETLEGHDGGVRCAGRRINDLRFADDIDMMEEDEESLREVTRRLDETSKRFGMEISTEKSKVMIAGKREYTENQVVKVMVDGVELEQVRSFTYLGSRIEDNGKSKMEMRVRIGRATCALAKLDVIWRAKNIRMENKLLLLRSVVAATLLYACESWTMNKKDEQRLRAFEMKTYRRLLGITWREKKTNEWVLAEMNRLSGRNLESFVEMVRKRKFKFFGHMMRADGLERAVIEGGMEGRRERGRPQGSWLNNLKDWSGKRGAELGVMARNRERWRIEVGQWVHPRPNRLRT